MARYFVDSAKSDDTGDGLTWANAKKTIQAALTAAASGSVSVNGQVARSLGLSLPPAPDLERALRPKGGLS